MAKYKKGDEIKMYGKSYTVVDFDGAGRPISKLSELLPKSKKTEKEKSDVLDGQQTLA